MSQDTVKPLEHARLLLICASFVNLSLLPMWMHYESDYLEPLPYPELVAIVLGVGLCLFLVASLLRPYWQNRALQAVVLISFLLFPIDGVRQALGISAGSLSKVLAGTPSALFRGGMLVAVLLLIAAWHRFPTRIMAGLAGLLLILSPLLLFCGALAITRSGPANETYLHYAKPQSSTSRRFGPVFLLVFDEADYGLIFANRPADLALSSFDGLAERSASFTRAYSPGRDTVLSLPALLMGESLEQVSARGQALAATTIAGTRWADWRESDHLLSPRNSASRPTAVIGFYHPYCTITGLAYCSHHRVYPYRRWAFELMPAPLAALQTNIAVKRALKPYLPRAVQLFSDTHQKMFDDISAELLNLPPSYDLVFAHINMPHPTAVPVAAIRRFGKLSRADYYRNLQRTDAFLRRFIEHVSSRYSDKNPVIIVTSDHGLRYASWAGIGYDVSDFADLAARPQLEDFHVPLLIHFPASARGVRIDKPVNNLHVKALIEAVLNGSVRDEAGAARFLLSKPFVAPRTTTATFGH